MKSVAMSAQSSRVEFSMLEKVAICSCGMSGSLRKLGLGRQGWKECIEVILVSLLTWTESEDVIYFPVAAL